MASSMLLRRSSAAASNLLKSKFLHPLRSESLAPAATRSFNTNAQLRDSEDDERSLDIDRRPQTGVRRREFPPSFFSDVFDPFSPTRSISQVLNLIDQLAENTPRGGAAGFAGGLRRGWDAKEDKDALHLRVEMPGLGKEDVRISVEENTLIIQGEVGEKEAAEEGEDSGRRRYSSRIELTPKLYKVDAIKAEMKNGVLKVSVPKVKEEERRDVFQVKVD